MSLDVATLGRQASPAGLLWGVAILMLLGDGLRRILAGRCLPLPSACF